MSHVNTEQPFFKLRPRQFNAPRPYSSCALCWNQTPSDMGPLHFTSRSWTQEDVCLY